MGLQEDTHHHHHPSIDANSGSHYRDKDPHPARFNADSNANKKRSAEDQHSGQASRTKSRVSQNNDNSYYSEQDETSHQFSHRSRSRSPVYKTRRDHAGSYDRHRTRTRDEFHKRGGDQSSNDYGLEDKASRKPRETRYHHSIDLREEEAAMMTMKGGRSSDCDERSRKEHLQHDGVSDPRLRRQRSELTGEKETQRREGDDDGEGRFLRRSSEIPCKFFAAGNCRNGQHCRFSHHGGADRKQPQDNKNNFYRHDNNYHSDRWNGDERLDNGKLSKGTSETKGGSWIGDMEMSPDWNYGSQEPGVGSIGQSSKSRADDQRSSCMYSYGDKEPMVEKPLADSNQNYNMAPVQAYNQNHNALPLTAGGSQQVIVPGATDFSVGLYLSNPKSGKAYQDNHHSVVEKAVSGVTREQIDNISATIAQFLANGQPIPQLTQALQMPLQSESSMAIHSTQSNNPLGMSNDTVTTSQVSNVDEVQELPVNPKASEENGDTKTTNEASKEEECNKSGGDGKDAEDVMDEDDDDGSDEEEEDKKEMKDPKGMRTFKFALVEIVKELLKPAWKEGKMSKDGYKKIVKKVVEKVSGSMQSGNVPQSQEKIDHYLSASKPKLTKLVQAYISKVKKT